MKTKITLVVLTMMLLILIILISSINQELMQPKKQVTVTNKEEAKDLLIDTFSLEREVEKLKIELNEHVVQLEGGQKIIKENKGVSLDSEIALPNGKRYKFREIKRAVEQSLMEVKKLKPIIAEKEQQINEMKKQANDFLDKGTEEEDLPTDDEQLKAIEDVLDLK